MPRSVVGTFLDGSLGNLARVLQGGARLLFVLQPEIGYAFNKRFRERRGAFGMEYFAVQLLQNGEDVSKFSLQQEQVDATGRDHTVRIDDGRDLRQQFLRHDE